MVYLPLLQKMREMYEIKLQEYIKKHPGSYLLLEEKDGSIVEIFYSRKKDLTKALKKYEGLVGATIFTEHIPRKTHRFNPDNKTLEFLDYHVEVCPNDNKTRLEVAGPVEITYDTREPIYREFARCPDCDYKVKREPSKKTIKEVTKRSLEIRCR